MFDIINIVEKGQRDLCKFCKKDYSCQPAGETGHLMRYALKHDDWGMDAMHT